MDLNRLRDVLGRAGSTPLPALSVLVTAALGTFAGPSAGVQAQQSLPGIIIAAPPPSGPPTAGPPPGGIPGMMIQQPPSPPQAQAPAATPKPKPKVAARPKAEPANAEAAAAGKGSGSTRIALLVNGDPITAYEIEQRARLMALSADLQSKAQENMKRLATSDAVNSRWKQIVQETIQAHNGKTREQIIAIIQEKQKVYSLGLQKQAVESARASAFSQPEIRAKAKEELIDEIIKIQDAKRNGAAPDESMVEDLIKDIAQRNTKTPKEFAEHFAGMGVDISTLKARFRAQLAWTDAVRKQYAHLAVPGNLDLDRILQKDAAGGEDQLELQLHRIVIPVPPKVDQKAMAQRLSEAEQLQGQFKDCKTTAGLAGKVQGARFEDMGARRVSSFTGVSKTMLQSAQDNTMIPPSMTSGGIELLAVCGRKLIKAVDIRRNEEANKMRQDQMELIARGHLRKLRTEAQIETR